MKYELVIKNGTVVTARETARLDVGVTGSRIAAVNTGLDGQREIDASGKLILPGGVDMHVHLEMDAGNYTSSDDFYEGTRAAACGGTTTIVDFVEPEEEESLLDALAARQAQANPKAVVDYSLHMTIGPAEIGKLDQLKSVFDVGIKGFKIYMAYGFRLNDGEILEALEEVREVGGVPLIHAENWDVIQVLNKKAVAEGRTEPKWHPECRPPVFEAEAVERVITIADYVGLPVHIFHVSCLKAAETIREARERGLEVTGETCPQYLFLDKALYSRPGVDGALPVCAPPLREKADQDYLWEALGAGTLQTIGSDHCPFTTAEKQEGMSRFDTIPGGVPSIEIRYPSLYTGGVRTGRLTLQQWVDLCSASPARLLGLERKGDIAPGFDADLVIFDPDKELHVRPETLHETAGWSPYEGMTFKGWPETVISRGSIVVERGNFVGSAGHGRFLE